MYPTLLHLGHLTLPTFGVVAALGLMGALVLSERTARLAGVDPGRLWDAGIFAVVAAFVSSRLLLVAFYWHSFRAFPVLLLTVPSLTASGLLLTVVATLGWLWFKRIPMLRALDAWAPCGCVVWACLALGHFAEGSDPGMASTVPWALAPMSGEVTRLHPVALYVAVLAALLAYGAYRLLALHKAAAGYTLAAAGLGQFLVSFLRQPGAVGFFGLDVLQCAALGMVVGGSALILMAPATME